MQNAFSVAQSFVGSLPVGVIALTVLVVGWLAAYLLRFLLSKGLELVRFNRLADKIGIGEFLRKGQVRHQPSRLVGSFASWTIRLVTLFQIARILDIKIVNAFSDRLASIVPGLLAGIFIGIVGLLLVSFLGNFVMTVARTAGFPHAPLLARVVKIAGYILVLGLALEQVDLSRSMISALFQILFAAIVFGLALAFGLGCKDLARDASVRFLQNLREKRRNDGHSDLEG
jgi:hypothetical protein